MGTPVWSHGADTSAGVSGRCPVSQSASVLKNLSSLSGFGQNSFTKALCQGIQVTSVLNFKFYSRLE